MPEVVRQQLNVLDKTPFFTVPTEWTKYLELALEMYQVAYPDKLSGSIFKEEKKEKKEEPKAAAAPSEKKAATKGKGKGKMMSADKSATPAAPADAVCTYCKQKGHYHLQCQKLAADKAAGTFVPYKQRMANEAAAAANSGSGKGKAPAAKQMPGSGQPAPQGQSKVYRSRMVWEEVAQDGSTKTVPPPQIGTTPATVGTLNVLLTPTTRLEDVLHLADPTPEESGDQLHAPKRAATEAAGRRSRALWEGPEITRPNPATATGLFGTSPADFL